MSVKTMQYPRKRSEDLSIELLNGETLIYDETSHKAHCLNAVASAVWEHCDGKSTIEQIAATVTQQLCFDVTVEAVLVAVDDFHRDNLLDVSVNIIPVSAVSRRQMMMKLGIGAAMAVPVIATIVAPKAAQAYSGCANC